MPEFSQESLKKLATCHADLQVLFHTVIKQIDCVILEGHRDEAAQEAAFKAGKSKLHWPNGKHNSIPSAAVDVSPYPVFWSNTTRFYFFAGYVLAVAIMLYRNGTMKHQIRWGGDWNHNYDVADENGLSDLVHFEIIV